MFGYFIYFFLIIFKNSFAGKDFGKSNDYCVSNLCSTSQGRHVACENDDSFGAACGMDAHIVPLSKENIDAILTSFNALRNQVARGGFNGFSPATRMATMSWDEELAYVAEKQVKTCSLEHSSCRNTAKYKNVGQTVAYKAFKGKVPDINDIVKEQIDFWFNEYKYTTMEAVVKLKDLRSETKKHYGNFMQLIQDQTNAVGCAILQDNKNEWFRQFMTCNYGYGNAKDKPVFVSGATAASDCQTGANSDFPNLCAAKESYDQNSVGARMMSDDNTTDSQTDTEDATENSIENGKKKSAMFDNFLSQISKNAQKFSGGEILVQSYGHIDSPKNNDEIKTEDTKRSSKRGSKSRKLKDTKRSSKRRSKSRKLKDTKRTSNRRSQSRKQSRSNKRKTKNTNN